MDLKSKIRFKRLLALVLSAVMICTSISFPVNATEATTETVGEPLAVVWAGSDFQYGVGETYIEKTDNNKVLLDEILNKMYDSGFTQVDEALICGDLTANSGKAASDYGAETFLESLNEAWGLTEDEVLFTTGNHDSAGFDLNDATGGYDRAYYSVYNINYSGFPIDGSEKKIKETAAALDTWLSAKADENYGKPIFVMTHLPLHHNGRFDNYNAKYIVDVLNEAGERGLNIIFMFGHNHSGGYDRYIGGSCIFYEPGSTMLVSDPEKQDITGFTEETINFTYMNAGYVGYVGTGESGATLSATAFEIYKDRVEIQKYNKDGLVNLKNAGAHSSSFDAKDADGNYLWDADIEVAESPQILNLSDIVLSVDSVNTTLGANLEKGKSAVVSIGIGECENPVVTWESYDPKIAAVTADESEPTKATIIAENYGVTKIQATVQDGIARTAGVPATITFDVNVVPDDAVELNNGEPLTLYAPVENLYDSFDVNSKYMILNTNQVGNAKAFGGADSSGGKNGNVASYVKNVEVFSGEPLLEGNYTYSSDGYDTWKFVEDTYGYGLKLSDANYYVGANQNILVAGSGTYPCNMRITTTMYVSTGTAVFNVVNNSAYPLETAKAYVHANSALTSYDLTGYTLNYNMAEQYFQLTKSGNPIYPFKEAITLDDVWMWTEGTGSVSVETTGITGGLLYFMQDEQITSIDITTDMVSGVRWNVPGTYAGTVTYMGTVVTDNYEVTVTSEDGAAVHVITLIDSDDGPIYKLWDIADVSITENQYYAAVYKDGWHKEEGIGRALTLAENGNLITEDILIKEFTVNDKTNMYIQPSNQQLWYHTSTIDGQKLSKGCFWQNKGDTLKYLSVTDGTPVATDLSTTCTNDIGWRNSGSSSYLNLITTKNDLTIIPNDENGWKTVGRYADLNTRIYYEDTELDEIVAFIDKNSGTVESGSTGHITPGGNIIVGTYFQDGSYTTENIPIDLSMLDIKAIDLVTPGVYSCTVTYAGKVFSTDYQLTVTGTAKEMKEISDDQIAYLTDNNGTVTVGSGGSILTDDEIVIYTLEDGGIASEKRVPISVSMLSTTKAQLNATSSYTGLTVTYNNHVYSENYNLTVVNTEINDYPEFPDEGAVKLDKWADTSQYDYFGTGSAQINLSVTGIPSRNKANAVVIVDASSSMRLCIHNASADSADKWDAAQRESFISFLKTDINRALTDTEKELFQSLYNSLSSVSDAEKQWFNARMNANGTINSGLNENKYAERWLEKAGYCSDTGKFAGTDANECPTREVILEDALVNMLKEFATADEDGYVPDVDVAIAYFNSYTQIENDYIIGADSHFGASASDGGEVILDFINSTEITEDICNNVRTNYKTVYGTNYDDAMQQAYDLLSAKQVADYEAYLASGDTATYEPRQDFVIFMSDGQPYQFNYFGGDSGNWQKWFNGTMDEALASGQTYADAGFVKEEYLDVFEAYYHPDGKMWMAEAIKGDETDKYKIIDPDADTQYHITEVNGLGATMMTIGFNLGLDGGYHDVMQRIATNDSYYTACETADDIEKAFGAFATMVRSANNAVFTDQMGEDFDLQMKTSYITGDKETVTLNPGPMIQVKVYETWKHSDKGSTYTKTDGTTATVTESMVGTRKSEVPEILETVVFNEKGTAAYSEQVDLDGDGTYGCTKNADGTYRITDTDDNILIDEVICASRFWYNTSLSKEKAITVNSQKISLGAETFYWNIGGVSEDEIVLSYYVYLTESMEGNRAAGSYETNEYAKLNYTNYAGNACEQSIPTPILPWKQATVGYGFYLVDDSGHPIINQTTGQTGSFEQSVRLTSPIYQDILFNTESTTIAGELAFKASDKLPHDVYTLFDAESAYSIQISSTGQGRWEITNDQMLVDTDGKEILTTYVTQYSSTETSTTRLVENSDTYSYTNTVVWFAVKANVQCVPDTVVVDYGLPVDIDVLSNDMMIGSNGTLEAIGTTVPASKSPVNGSNQSVNEGYKDTINLNFGDAKVRNGKIRYSLNTMEMKDAENFYYAVKYSGTVGTNGYYYSDVTVIPATTIYYEDNFLDYKVYSRADSGSAWALSDETWGIVGKETDSTQAQDRPGEFSLSGLDANNIYGYDQAYKNTSTYSLGSARVVNVNANKYATAEFEFWGTGFDIVSLTSNTSGTIRVKVYDLNDGNALETSGLVDTYYGYTYGDSDNDGDNEWYVDPNASDTLYQVPVLKIADLPYSNYKVTITASYATMFDHEQYGDAANYDFYLDAIRIYDPANDGADNQVIEDAYAADSEGWPEYHELRNLLIDANTFDSLNESDSVNGIVFIDGNAALTDEKSSASDEDASDSVADAVVTGKSPAISDYANYGPNNEVYLAPGQGIAFTLNMTGDVAGIHLAYKSVGGKAYAKVYNAADNESMISANTVNTATDQYYDITNLNGKTVVIINTGAATDAILSITNIKVTYNSDPYATGEASEFTPFRMTRSAANLALLSLEEPVTVFEPELLKVSVDKTSAKIGSKLYVTITSSTDVESVTVNDKVIYTFTTNRAGNRQWKMKITAEEAGELLISAAAYDAEDIASEAVETVVTVTEQKTNTIDKITDIVIGIFDSLFSKWF